MIFISLKFKLAEGLNQNNWIQYFIMVPLFHWIMTESCSFWIFILMINQKFESPITWGIYLKQHFQAFQARKNEWLNLTMTFKIFLFSQLKILLTTRWMLLLPKATYAKRGLLQNFSYKFNTFSIILCFSMVLAVFSTNLWQVGGGLLLSF